MNIPTRAQGGGIDETAARKSDTRDDRVEPSAGIKPHPCRIGTSGRDLESARPDGSAPVARNQTGNYPTSDSAAWRRLGLTGTPEAWQGWRSGPSERVP